MSDERWNHNIHLHPVVLDAVPAGARRAFDVVASIAALHHMDATAGLRAMRDLVRPGGVLVVIGLARPRLPRDVPWELAGAVTTRWLKLSRTYWEHSAPIVWPPPETYDTMRAIAGQVLPGARYRRHVLWRYSLLWERSR